MGNERMRFFLAYFWFLGLPVGLVLTWQVWTALKSVVQEGLVEPGSATRFTQVFACLFTIPYLLLGVFQVLGGYDRPDYPSAFVPDEPYAFAAWVVQVGFGLVAIVWFWFGNAAPVLAAFARRTVWIPTHVFMIKLIVTALAVVLILITTFMPPKITL